MRYKFGQFFSNIQGYKDYKMQSLRSFLHMYVLQDLA